MNVATTLIFRFIGMIIFILTLSAGANARTVVKQLSNTEGLSNNSVNCVFEDSEHIVWVGTWDGLNAYNGRDMKTYRHNKNDKHSISHNIIRRIIEQNAAYLWVSTDYGVNRWDKEKQQFTSYYLGTEHRIPKQEKSFLLSITAGGKIMCYVKDQGLFFFDDAQQNFAAVDLKLKEGLKDFVTDKDNNAYLLYEKGTVVKYKISEHKDVTFTDPCYVKQTDPVSGIFPAGDFLILNYAEYIKITDKESPHPITLKIDKGKTISQIICHNHALLLTFYEGGCMRYDLKNQSYTLLKNIPDKVSIFTIHAGSQDVLWLGTDGQGLLKIYQYNSPFSPVHTHYPVRTFCQTAQDLILVGMKGGGIKLFNKAANTLTDYLSVSNGLISNSVYALKKNNAGDIFIGTEGAGINILSQGKKLERLVIPDKYPSFRAVYSIRFTNNDTIIWLGTSGCGLIKVKLTKPGNRYVVEDVKQYTSSGQRKSLNNNVIYSIETGETEDELWLGTRGGGLNRFNVKNETFERLEEMDSKLSITNSDVLTLIKGNDGCLWAGTSYGLNRLSLHPLKVTEYTESQGLPNNTIHGILEDADKNIWVSSNKGISCMDIQTGQVTNYSTKDGLQNDEFSDGASFRDEDDCFYFGGVSGFNGFATWDIHLRDFEPTLGLSSLKVYNTEQNIRKRINNNTLHLSYDEPYVTLTFVAQEFINNENCEYGYRLLNFSDEWIKNGNNPHIVFTKLPPGNYRLEVKCTNGDGVWSNNIYALHIKVAYPWWLSIPAFMVYLFFILIIIYIAQSVIRNRIKLNRQLLLEQIEKQHQQKTHESKLNFFTNVAHEFLTPLTLIYGPAQHLLEKSDLDSYSKRYIYMIKNNADRMKKLISELMEFRKAESGHASLQSESIDLRMLIDYITDNYTEIAEENKISFEVETKDISSFVTDRNSLEKILFNLISNAFKYTPIGGYIRVTTEQCEDKLFFGIKNSGSGLTDKQRSDIFDRFKIFESSKLQHATSTGVGLNLTKSLVELLNGTISVDSEPGQYVAFNVVIKPMPMREVIIVKEDTDKMPVNREFVLNRKDVFILIVEDEKHIREFLKDILATDYFVKEAENGEEALRIIEQDLPNIIISDILMPHLDGIGLIDCLRKNPKTAHIPMISISAKNSPEDQINAYEHGIDLYITKPFHPRHVLATVENLIHKQSALKDYFQSARSAVTIKDGITMHKEDECLLQEIVSFVEKNIDDESLNPNSISDFLGVSKATLYRKLKELTDKTPSEFVRNMRLQYASRLLTSTKLTVAEIMFKSGFSNKSYFYREFAKLFGKPPKEYRSMGENSSDQMRI